MSSVLTNEDSHLAELVTAYGCPAIIPLRHAVADSPSKIPYLDLLSKQVRETAPLLPHAVAEFQGRPVMYFIDGTSAQPADDARLELQQRLANRGDHAVLAVVRSGNLTLYPLHLDKNELNLHALGKVVAITDPKAPFLFQSVAAGEFELPGQPKDADPVFAEIQRLLKRAVADLVVAKNLDGLEVLSMTGRALFFRFLIDRFVVETSDLKEICPAAYKSEGEPDLKGVFSNAERAAQTSAWLDETFNGDLLPLIKDPEASLTKAGQQRAYREAYLAAGKKSDGLVFRHLESILRGCEQVQGGTQLTLLIDWDDLNFRHIPIGVLSQVYEDFSHQVDEQDSLDRSVHYTPRSLAKLMVDEALNGLEAPHDARILDPACGAGVFLVLALRELVRLRWEHDRKRLGRDARRPSKQVIQGILHRQICGFDISESALRLAALGLYITVIELNEITRPPSEHHAGKALQGLVLFNQRGTTGDSGFVIGSLGPSVDPRFNGTFDLVVGNPPWTRLDDNAKAQVDEAGTQIAQRVLRSRELDELASAYENPGGVPDVPFLWRSLEWAKPEGIISFALDARLILTPTGPIAEARQSLFRAMEVTGILNGSDLEKTAVWSGHDQAWILIWARNRKPDLVKHAIRLLTPMRENDLAARGTFRLDFQSAYPVPLAKALEYSWLCKALAIGTTLDVQIMERLIAASKIQSIGSFWRGGDPAEQGPDGLRGREHAKPRSHSHADPCRATRLPELASTRGLDIKPFKNRKAPAWLLDLEVFDGESEDLLSGGTYLTYREKHGDREPNNTRSRENFRHPLVLFSRAPGESRDSAKSVRLLKRDLGFSKNYYGYSSAGHPESPLICALLHVIAHSSLFQHFTYMFSGQIGARRRIIDKKDIDAFPFPILDTLSKEVRSEALAIANSLDGGVGHRDWKVVDGFVGRLYGLGSAEQQVVADTVAFNGPYRSIRGPASLPAPPEEINDFARTLQTALQPFFKVVNQKVKVAVVPRIDGHWEQPWRFATILLDGDEWKPYSALLASVMTEASKTSASRVILALPRGGLVLGMINKRRLWTKSRARLCALHIAREHLEKSFPLPRSK